MSGLKNERHDTSLEATARRDFRLRAVELPPRPASLKMLEGPGAPRDFTLQSRETTIGRSAEATVSVADTELSRIHCVLLNDGLELTCVDNESTNGVYLNGVKIHSAKLRDGDTLQLGNVVFVFHQGR